MIDINSYVVKMPALNTTSMAINRVLADSQHSIQDIIKIVEKDPVLSSEMLKYANAPMYGFTSEITSVARAVSLFGVQQVRTIAVMSSVRNDNKVDLSPYGSNEQAFLNASITGAALISKWRPRSEHEVLYMSAFLMYLGKILCANALKNEGKTSDFAQVVAEKGSYEAEKEFFGMGGMEISSYILEKYKMHKDAIGALRNAFNYKSLPEGSKERTYAAIMCAISKCVSLKDSLTKPMIDAATEICDLEALDSSAFLNAVSIVKR